jgi:DNA-binding transcriptional regulator YdaS (Cro superfamily)
MSSPLDKIDITGAELARKLGVSKQIVSHWKVGRYRVPAERCREIEQLTGGVVTVHELRPDVFGPPDPPPGAARGRHEQRP